MRILHTSDWHLGARLGNQDRLEDQFARLEELCRHLDEQEADLLLVAGDVFDEHRADSLARIVVRLAKLLSPRIEAGLTAVFIPGNHDREHVFPLLRGLQELVAPGAERRVIFAERPGVVRVTGKDGDRVQLVLVPYPTPLRYGLADQRWPSPDAKRQTLTEAVRASLRTLEAEARTEGKGLPTVMCGHFLVRGVTVGLYQLTEAEDVPVEPGDLPSYSYVALGHIHKAQPVSADYVRYCGSLERMDRGEAADEKVVLSVDIAGSGLQEIRPLPVGATPFAHVDASSETDLEQAAERLPEPHRTLVSLTMSLRREQNLGDLLVLARRLFSRLYSAPEICWTDAPSRPSRPSVEVNRHDVPGTVRAYLREVLRGDPDEEALVHLAEELVRVTEDTR
jgi:exonuclease SbcD